MKLHYLGKAPTDEQPTVGCKEESKEGDKRHGPRSIPWALTSLNEEYSLPFLLYYRGHEFWEIAEQLRLPVATVKQRIFLARHQLRTTLKLSNYQNSRSMPEELEATVEGIKNF